MNWFRVGSLMAMAWFGAASTAVGAPNQTDVTLLLSARTAAPGETVYAGLRLRMAPEWHTYWVNPGEAGKATEVQWTLPEGIAAGPILWPVPEKYNWSGLVNYIYHHEAILLVPLSLAPGVSAGLKEIKAKVSWLECKEQCVVGSDTVSASFTVGAAGEDSPDRARIEQGRKRLPQPFPNDSAKARWEKAAEGDKRPVVVSWNRTSEATRFDFYPRGPENVMVQPATEVVVAAAPEVRLRKVVEKLEGDWPKQLSGLLVEQGADGSVLAAFDVTLALPALGEAAGGGAGGSVENAGGPGLAVPRVSLGWMLWLAFLGGLILNVMPCVLPVIALKILGFVNQQGDAPGEVRKLGLIYGVGVVCSFLVLAGLVIGVQKAGKTASWGMQFGNPVFLVCITVLVMLVALNLFGIFEVTLGGRAMGAAGTLTTRKGASGAFFNGVLATALATPCTAPFLSVALGVAFTQSPGVIVLVFTTVGLGLAAPYVVLSFQPGWLRFLPKPGSWMNQFKTVMGFPMLATAVWLFSILTRHYGKDGILWVGLFLVVVALVAWIWGEFVQRASRGAWLARAVCVLLVLLGYLYALESQLRWRSPAASTEGKTVARKAGGIPWEPWSPEAVAKGRAEGRPVFVDFTADWCLTCKFNKQQSIEIPAVRARLQEVNALALLADNTLVRQDIAEELQKYGRAGVPLVLVYPKQAERAPIVLPTVLTPGVVLAALEEAAK